MAAVFIGAHDDRGRPGTAAIAKAPETE